jgi:hypothetical protein
VQPDKKKKKKNIVNRVINFMDVAKSSAEKLSIAKLKERIKLSLIRRGKIPDSTLMTRIKKINTDLNLRGSA